MSATMAFSRFGDYIVTAHTAAAPTDEEWARYLHDSAQWLPECVGFLIVTDGGGPTSRQRRELERTLKAVRHGARFAVVSSSLLGRGIVVAISLFNPTIRAFRPDDLAGALDYLRVPPPLRPQLLAELERQKARLSP